MNMVKTEMLGFLGVGNLSQLRVAEKSAYCRTLVDSGLAEGEKSAEVKYEEERRKIEEELSEVFPNSIGRVWY